MLKIAFDHATFQLKDMIQKLCASFFKDHGFNYFQYLRCYKDGSCSLLANETGLVKYFSEIPSEPVIFSSYTSEHENQYSYWFLWDEELPEFPVSL